MDLGSVCFEVHLGSDLSSDNLYSLHSRNINYLFTFCFMKKKITKKEFTKKIYFLCIVCIECWWKVLALWDFPHHRGFDINIDLKHYRMIDDKWCIRNNWTDSKQNLRNIQWYAPLLYQFMHWTELVDTCTFSNGLNLLYRNCFTHIPKSNWNRNLKYSWFPNCFWECM